MSPAEDDRATPELDEVLEARGSRQKIMSDALMSTTPMDSACQGRLAGFTRRGAFQVVVAEEWFHLGFGRRDLAAIGSS